MKRKSLTICILSATLFLVNLTSLRVEGTQEQKKTADKEESVISEKSRIIFARPLDKRGFPVRMVGAGSRGVGQESAFLSVLSPLEIGLTTQEQPSLFWYLSEPTTMSFFFTLTALKKIPETVLELKLRNLNEYGISRLDLSALKVSLEPEVRYLWSVALMVDPDNPSKNIISSTVIKRENPSENVLARLTQINMSEPGLAPIVASANRRGWLDDEKGLELARVYAESGFFLDALAVLSNLVDANPTDTELQELRKDFLEQAELELNQDSP